MKRIFLNGKLIKGNETLKEGDCIVCIDNIEGTVYKFQGDKNFEGVNGSFKEKVINAMCELYCQYKKENKKWTILEISSAYRDAKNQARVMIDTYIDQGRRKMSEIYASDWDKAVDLISDLYYDDNHLRCEGMCLVTGQALCVYGVQQRISLSQLPHNERGVFQPYIDKNIGAMTVNLKNNKVIAKMILEEWIKVTNILSNHTIGKALDFSKNNYNQHDDFDKILRKSEYNLKVGKVYTAGNFHVEPL